MASLRKRLELDPTVRNPRAVARHRGRKRHGTHSVARLKARKRGLMRARM
jgi:hypothetical protein